MSEQASPSLKSQLRSGLIVPERFHMPTLFTLIIFWWSFWMLAIVFVPFLLLGDTDSRWVNPGTVGFLSCVIAVSTGHGALGYWMGYMKGGSVRNFVIGALLGPIGLLIVGAMTKSKPDSIPERPRGLMKILDRLAFACGNLWFGIAQIAIMAAFLVRATIYETEIADKGNEAAYASYYNSPLFGLIFLLFFVTIYAATMRKYPFRWHQIGWLATHTGLLTLMVGCMIMYWGSFSGFVQILEGHTADHVFDRDIRDITVKIPSLGYRGKHRVSIDRDPEAREVHQEIPISFKHNGSAYDLKIEIDQHLGRAEFYTGIKEMSDGPHNHSGGEAGVRFSMTAPGFSQENVVLEAHNNGVLQFSGMDIRVRTFDRQYIVDSIGHVYDPKDQKRGMVRVYRKGKHLADIPVELEPDTDTGSAGRMIKAGKLLLGENGPTIKIERFYATLGKDKSGLAIDENPQVASNPGVLVSMNGANGKSDVYATTLNGRSNGASNVYGLEFEYACLGEIQISPGMVVFILDTKGQWTVALGSRSGTKHEKLEIGHAYSFSENSPIRITPEEVIAHASRDESVRASTSRNNFRAIHAKVTFEGESEELWLVNGLLRPQEARLGGQRIQLAYGSRKVPLGFELSCLDFRHENYANASGKAKTYETNVVLRDKTNGVEEAILIDMNHPLAYEGFRFFNGSPIRDESTHSRGIVLTVGRNPGYSTIIVASIITCLGIIIVFFFKKRIRDWDTRRRSIAAQKEEL